MTYGLPDDDTHARRPRFTRIHKPHDAARLLESCGRRTIYELVRSNPGISFQHLRAQCPSQMGAQRMAVGTLAYHLDQLERYGFIVSRRGGRFRRFFDATNGLANQAEKLALLQNHPLGLIAHLIACRPGAPRPALLVELGKQGTFPRGSFYMHVARLVKQGLVQQSIDSGRSLYHPTPSLLRLLRAAGISAPSTAQAADVRPISGGPMAPGPPVPANEAHPEGAQDVRVS